MGKSLDGIKKINQSGLERSRRIVLRAIGEKEGEIKEEKTVKPSSGFKSSGRVDGLNKFSFEVLKKAAGERIAYRREEQKKLNEEAQRKINEAKKVEEERARQERIETARREEEARIAQEEKKKEEERVQREVREKAQLEAERKEEKKKAALLKKEEKERARREEEARMRLEKARKEKEIEEEKKRREDEEVERLREEEMKKAEKKRRREEEARKKAEEDREREEAEEQERREKKRRKEIEIKRLVEEEKKRQKEIEREVTRKRRREEKEIRKRENEKRREEQRIKRKEMALKFKLKAGQLSSVVKKGIIFSSKKFLPGVFILLAVYGVIYLGLCAFLLVFQVNNENLKKLGNYFPPVPALINTDWVVDYYVYADAVKEGKTSAAGAKDYFIEKEALDELYGRYKLPTLFLGEEALKEKAEKLILADNEINRAGLARIKKIRELANGNNFLELGAKYADNHRTAKISELGLELPGGLKKTLSPVITGKDGYYILEANKAVWEDDSEVNYVFVRAVTLTDYVLEKKNNSKVWALARD